MKWFSFAIMATMVLSLALASFETASVLADVSALTGTPGSS